MKELKGDEMGMSFYVYIERRGRKEWKQEGRERGKLIYLAEIRNRVFVSCPGKAAAVVAHTRRGSHQKLHYFEFQKEW